MGGTPVRFVPTIEAYGRKYPDVPREVILKEDVLRLGLRFSEEAMRAAEGSRLQSYYLFSYNMTPPGEAENGAEFRTPEDIVVCGGDWDLLPTLISVRLASTTPYLVDVRDGRLTLLENGVAIAPLRYPQRPWYYDLRLADGTPYPKVVNLLFNHGAFVNTLRGCQFWGPGEECLFCDINATARRASRFDDEPQIVSGAIRKVDQVAEVIKVMAAEQDPEIRLVTIWITGGSIIRPVRGVANVVDFQIPYVEAIRAEIGHRLPLVLIVEAQPAPELKRLKDAGVTVFDPNLEVWDERLFRIICPGKEKYVGRATWLRRTLAAVDVFGEGFVSPCLVAGIEMAQPFGFKTVAEAVRSTREGFEFLMSHGVVPHLDTWCIEPGSRLAGQPPVSLDYLIQVDVAWYETWKKYSLPPFMGFGPMGSPGRAVYGHTGSVDMGEFPARAGCWDGLIPTSAGSPTEYTS